MELYGLDAAQNYTLQLLVKLVLLTAQSVSPNTPFLKVWVDQSVNNMTRGDKHKINCSQTLHSRTIER